MILDWVNLIGPLGAVIFGLWAGWLARRAKETPVATTAAVRGGTAMSYVVTQACYMTGVLTLAERVKIYQMLGSFAWPVVWWTPSILVILRLTVRHRKVKAEVQKRLGETP